MESEPFHEDEDTSPTYVMRVWMPDRPGALAAVAGRIGAVRGDVIGIDILETGSGMAIDELVVRIPDAGLIDLLVREVNEVDGVKVEDVRPLTDAVHDPRLDALETAAVLVGASTPGDLLDALCLHASRTLGASWMAVVDADAGDLRAAAGAPPSIEWLTAFVAGSRLAAGASAGSGADVAGPDDVAWAPLAGAGLAVVLGREHTVFRARERRQVAALARIVDTRYRELVQQQCRLAHPSNTT